MLLVDRTTRQRLKVTLSYPSDADPGRGAVSVLSPVGCSLLGSRVGSRVRWRSPNGSQGTAEVVAVLYQPEPSGHYTS